MAYVSSSLGGERRAHWRTMIVSCDGCLTGFAPYKLRDLKETEEEEVGEKPKSEEVDEAEEEKTMENNKEKTVVSEELNK